MIGIEVWNRLALGWAEWVWQASFASLAVLVVISILWILIRRRVTAHVGHVLFLIPLVPLVLPPGILSGLVPALPESTPRVASLSKVMPEIGGERWLRAIAPVVIEREIAERELSGTANHVAVHEIPEAEKVRPAPVAWIFLGWALAVFALLIRFLSVQLATSRLVRSATSVERRPFPVKLAVLERQAGLRGRIRVLESDAIDSPAVWGVRRPALILPEGLAARLGSDELRWVLHHEFAHLRRRDLLIAAVQQVIQILWFFQPVAWITGRLVEELRECACDESALTHGTDVPRRRCAEALLHVAEMAVGRPRSRLALQTFHAPKAILERRIMRILDSRRSVRSGISLAAIPFLIITAAGTLGFAGVLVDDRIPPAPLGQENMEEIAGMVEILEGLDPAEDEAALLAAIGGGIASLTAAQAEDGGWYAGPDSSVPASGEFDRTGVTGLVLLTLLEPVPVKGHEPAPETLARGLSWLVSAQDPSTGAFGDSGGKLFMPSHAVATLAWLRSRGCMPEETWRPIAEKAVELILRSRNPYGAWRYHVTPNGENDSFITSLMLIALAEARDAGLELDADAREAGLLWIEEMTDPNTGRTGYMTPGSPVSRLADKAEDFPIEYTEMLTAMAITVRMRWGEKPVESEAIQKGSLLLTKTAPLLIPERGSIDYYYWLFGTDALKVLGGYQWDHWRASLLRATVPNQLKDGSWPAIDAWSSKGSTVHATALVTLALLHARE